MPIKTQLYSSLANFDIFEKIVAKDELACSSFKKTHVHTVFFFLSEFPLYCLFLFLECLRSKVVLRQIQTIQRLDSLKKRNERNSRKNDTSDTVCISHNFYCAIRIELCKNLLFMPQKESRFFFTTSAQPPPHLQSSGA